MPDPPCELGVEGRRWWNWAWKTPQSFGWSAGDDYTLARRAAMEDPKTVLSRTGEPVVVEGGTSTEKLALDDRLGLTPRGLAQLHWQIVAVADPARVAEPAAPGVSSLEERRAALTANAS